MKEEKHNKSHPKKVLEYRKTGILIPYARNSRTHSEAQTQQIAASIREFGFTNPIVLHFNRTVVHPDYVGFGLGMRLINETSSLMIDKGFRVMGKFSSLPIYKAMMKDEKWKMIGTGYTTPTAGSLGERFSKTTRNAVKWWSFEYTGGQFNG